jgi:hypothetical protein
MTITKESVSTFALMVDKLRLLSEAELKLAYISLFENDLTAKWKNLIEEMDLQNISDDEIRNTLNLQRQFPNA